MPFVPVTVQMPRPCSSRIGPCSMCTSTYALASAMRVWAASRFSMSTPCSASTVGQGVAVAVGQAAQHVDVERAHRRRAAEQAAAEAGALLVGPVDEGDGDRRAARRRRGVRSSSRPAMTPERAVEPAALRARCRGGCRRRACPRTRPGSTAHRLPAASVSTSTGSVRSSSRQQRTGLRATRGSTPGGASPSGPPVRAASSRRSVTTRAASYAAVVVMDPRYVRRRHVPASAVAATVESGSARSTGRCPATHGGGGAKGWGDAQVPVDDRRGGGSRTRRPARRSSTR